MSLVGFIGMGKLGLPCAEEMVYAGHIVTGYDIVQFNDDVVHSADTIEQCVAGAEFVFVAVPTPHEQGYDGRVPSAHLAPKDFNYDIVKEVIVEANKYMDDSQILVLISTVLPGTVREQIAPLITNTRFIYNPYLIAMGSVAWDMTHPEMVIIGTDDGDENGDAALVKEFYETMMQNDPRYVIGTWDECECIKVFYNTFISAKIGLVNMIQDVAQKQGNINVDIVTEALSQSSMRITGEQYMTAGLGDAGACHPRDNIALRFMSEKLDLGYDLFDAIMSAREIQAKNLAKLLVEKANEYSYDIIIHGKAYKPKVPYIDGSYSLLVGHYCEQLGKAPLYVDPLTGDNLEYTKPAVYMMAHSANVTYKYTQKHYDEELYIDIADGSVVIDPWRKYENDKCNVIHYGNTRLMQKV